MRKPEHQWETRLHLAHRVEAQAALGPRGEAFELRFLDGGRGWARCGLEQQQVDARGAADPDIVHAISAWLIARGSRRMDLREEGGRVLAAREIHPRELGAGCGGQRLISLCPSNLESIAALGCFDRVIACEDSSDSPAGVEGLERLGPDLAPDLGRVAELEPELVISSLSVPGMERTVTGLHARGLAQLVLAPRSLAEVLGGLERLGAALGVEDAAAAVVADMRQQMVALRERAQRIDPPARVYLEWWPRPMFSPGADCYSNELIALAGGVNVFGDRPGSSLELQPEELLHAAPELCFLSWCGVAADKLDPQRLIRRAGLATLEAATHGRVFPLDERFAGRPGPHMLEASRVMAAAIHQVHGERG